MKNPECSELSPELEQELLAAFPDWLNDAEEEMARFCFPQYVFYERVDAGTRWCWCTGCQDGFYVHKKMEPEFFRHKHGEMANCPRCGQRAALAAIGRYRSLNSLTATEKVVQLSTHGEYLLLQAGALRRDFCLDGDCVDMSLEWTPWVRYAFAPGFRMEWRRYYDEWFGRCRSVWGSWNRQPSVREPFMRAAYMREACYWPIGLEALEQSSMKYCQYVPWFDNAYGAALSVSVCDGEPCRVAWLVRYLAEYTRRPQMEMLMKLGHHDVVDELILKKNQSGLFVNWRAKDPAAFFRLCKQDYRVFRESELTLEQLRDFRTQKKNGLTDSLAEYAAVKRANPRAFEQVSRCVELAGVKLKRALDYLRRQEQRRLVFSTAATLWQDYLEAARQLGYDLSRDDVRMPKNLRERHDSATANLRLARIEVQTRAFRKRFEKLTEQFAFAADGLTVLAPASVEEIVAEGKALQHCVGGYAQRHAEGKVIILFLRRSEEPETPYVTIELTTDLNPGHVVIRQIHGYRNEMDGAPAPWAVHGAFLERWLEWIHDGSPRDEDGRPLEKIKVKTEVTAA